jgi:hypothetical protein
MFPEREKWSKAFQIRTKELGKFRIIYEKLSSQREVNAGRESGRERGMEMERK